MRGVASESTQTMPALSPRTPWTRCGTGFERNGGRCLTTKARVRPVPGVPRSPRTYVLDGDLEYGLREGTRTPTISILARMPPGCGTRSTPCWRARGPRVRLRSPSDARGIRSPELTERRRCVTVPASSANLGPGRRRSRRRDLAPPRAGGRRDGRSSRSPQRTVVPLDRSNLLHGCDIRRTGSLHESQRDPARPRPLGLVGGGDRRRG